MFSEDANYIHVEPMKSKHATEHIAAYQRGLDFFTKHGFKPAFERMDNASSAAFEQFCAKEKVQVQYVPPHNHRANKAERAIRTFKNHFIAMLATTDPNFPLCMWDELLPQAELTLNTLRSSALTPFLSAWAQLHGPYEYEQSPIAPAGMAVTIHERSTTRKSWAVHGVPGYYVGPAWKHRRCYRAVVAATCSMRVTDTLAWHPHTLSMPAASPMDQVSAAIGHLAKSLKTLAIDATCAPQQRRLLLDMVPTIADHLDQLAGIFVPPASESDSSASPEQSLPKIPDPQISRPATTASATSPTPPPPGLLSPLQGQEQSRTVQRVEAVPEDDALEQRVEEGETSDSASGTASIMPAYIVDSAYSEPAPQAIDLARLPYAPVLTRSGRITKPPAWALTAVDLDQTGSPLSYRAAMNGPDKALWEKAASEEFLRLLRGTKAMRFIHEEDKPADRTAAYYNPQVKTKIKAGKLTYRVRGTVGGDKIDYPGAVAANAAELSTIKLLFNAALSENADLVCADIVDYYLGTPLPRKEYMRIKLNQIPEDIQKEFKVRDMIAPGSGYVMVEINKGMYGLPQAGILAQERLITHLANHGYHQAANTACLFRHETRNTAFTLVVDDFAIKYQHKADADHLLDALRTMYPITVDWEAKKYVGITITHKRGQSLQLSMPMYIHNACKRFQVDMATNNTNAPAWFRPPKYGSKTPQKPTAPDTSTPLSPERTKRIQEIIGTLLYYARAVDPSMFTVINKIGSMQAKPTELVEALTDRLLQYAATWPDASIIYTPSGMCLKGSSDASYLSETNARSRAGGVLYLDSDQQQEDDSSKKGINGSIECISSIIPTVVSSAAEAEYAALFLVGQTAEGLRNTLADLGYPQKATPLVCDNSCAVGITNNTVKQKRSKAIDMRYHWIRDRVRQGHFSVEWQPGSTNLADFFTKLHTVEHHLAMRRNFVHYPRSDPALPTARSRRTAARAQVVDGQHGKISNLERVC